MRLPYLWLFYGIGFALSIEGIRSESMDLITWPLILGPVVLGVTCAIDQKARGLNG